MSLSAVDNKGNQKIVDEGIQKIAAGLAGLVGESGALPVKVAELYKALDAYALRGQETASSVGTKALFNSVARFASSAVSYVEKSFQTPAEAMVAVLCRMAPDMRAQVLAQLVDRAFATDDNFQKTHTLGNEEAIA